MLDYTVLQVLWWMILGSVLATYATTAGYDSGATIILPFLRKEIDRRIVLNVSAPTWDGNLTWIVFAGGGLFVVWPLVYSTAFSGMYAALLLILWSMFFRPPGYDYRSKINHHYWRRFWDLGLFVSSFFPVFLFGVATANAFVGFPFHFDPATLRLYYTGNLFGLFNRFGILGGCVSVTMVLMHGAAFVQRHTEGDLCNRFRRLHVIFSVLLMILFTLSGIMIMSMPGYILISSPTEPTITPLLNKVAVAPGAWFKSFMAYPWKFYAPTLAYASIIVSIWANYVGWLRLTFWSSVTAVGSVVATSGFALFPFIMPSMTDPNQSLTLWNSTSSQYALNTMFYVGVILLAIIICYKIFAFNAVWSKKRTITAEDIEQEVGHTYY